MDNKQNYIKQPLRKVASIFIPCSRHTYNMRSLNSIVSQMADNIIITLIVVETVLNDAHRELEAYIKRLKNDGIINEIRYSRTLWEGSHTEKSEFSHILHAPDFFITPEWFQTQIYTLDQCRQSHMCFSGVVSSCSSKNLHKYFLPEKILAHKNKMKVVNPFITSSCLFRTIFLEWLGEGGSDILLKDSLAEWMDMNKFAAAFQNCHKVVHYTNGELCLAN